ncbi:MAG: GAF domain-containing protein [Anaerolineae bacterium]|nr:GAF domain-containing protein [Anaerolineae bacterium]
MDETEQALREEIAQLKTLLEIGRIINSSLDLDQVLHIIVNSAAKLLDCEDCSITLADRENGQLRLVTSAKLLKEQIGPIAIPLQGSIAGWAVLHDEPVSVQDPQNDPRFFDQIDRISGNTTYSLLAVPMHFKEHVIGVIEAINKQSGSFTAADVEQLSILSAQAAVAIENARLICELKKTSRKLDALNHQSPSS